MECVYMIQNTKNMKIYIGSTVDYEKRKRSHINGMNGLYHDNRLINEDAKRFGSEVFKFRVLCVIDDVDGRYKLEEELIQKLKTYENGYNLSTDGRGRFIISEDFINACRVRMTGKNNPFYGKTHTKEVRDKLSELAKGRYKGENNPFYGKTHTQESIDKFRKSFEELKKSGWVNPQKGVPKSPQAVENNMMAQPNRKEVYAEGKIYPSMSACAKDLNISRTTVKNRVHSNKFPNYYYINK